MLKWHHTIALIWHTSKVIVKILLARLQQYMNWELLDVQVRFRKGMGTRDQIANLCWIIKKAREFHKNIYFCFIDYAIAFHYVNQEFSDAQARFRKDRGIWDQTANIHWIIEKSNRIPEKHLLLLHWLYQSFWLYGSYKLWKIPKEMGISDYLICRLRNLYADQEQLTWNNRLVPNRERNTSRLYTVTCLFSLYAEYHTKWMAGWSTSWNQDCREKYQ